MSAPRLDTRAIAAWQRAYANGRETAPWPAFAAPAENGDRAAADALAAWRRWHDPRGGLTFTGAEQAWFALLERARVETLAGRDLPGVARNLATLASLAPASEPARTVYGLARERLGGGGAEVRRFPLLPPARSGRLAAPRRFWLRDAAPAALAHAPADAELLDTLDAARALLADPPGFARVVAPLVRGLAACYDTPMDAGLARQAVADEPGRELENAVEDAAESPIDQTPASSASERLRDAGYAVFSRRWDVLVDAPRPPPADARAPDLPEARRRQVEQLARRLQRRLQAARLRRWSFDEEDGLLDNRRLPRLLAPAGDGAIFRQERTAPVPEACVTLLIDESGSMRGERRRLVALAVDFAVRTLERCGIRSEVLGYSTRFGGIDHPVVEAWRRAGSPAAPGRLNALRHVVHKSASMPWRCARLAFDRHQDDVVARENIDGEALAWAARRLAQRPEQRRILVVLCDGAPYDEATVRANGRAYLDDHLRAVIASIEAGPLHLVALGARRDVGRFYRHVITLRDADSVADALYAQLGDLLVAPDA